VIALFFIPLFFWGLETMSERKAKARPGAAPATPPTPPAGEPS
jgi:multidrug efflux pump